MKKYKDTIISIILAIILTFFIYHNFKVGGNNIIFAFLLIAFYHFFKTILKTILDKNEKRKNIIALIISILFSIIEVICISINKDYTLNNILDKWLIINIAGYMIIAYSIIIFIYNVLDKCKTKNITINILDKEIFKNEIFLTIMCIVLIFLAWIPYLVTFYPGILTSDSYSQVQQILDIIPLSNHHPITHTAIIGIFVKLGLKLFDNINIAISLYTIAQMIILSVFYALVIKFLRKNNVPIYIRIAILIYYMFYPVHAMYSLTMWKDVLFSGLFPVFLIYCIKLVSDTDKFLNNKKDIFLFVVISLFMILLRHNGLYVVTLLIPFIILVKRKFWKKLIVIFAIILILYQMTNVLIYNILKVNKGSIAEVMSIPLQQIARTIKSHSNEIDEDTKNKFNEFFIKENIWEDYIPTSSDSVKFKLDAEYFNANKIEFIKIWMKLLIKYPKDYIEATLANSYGYYYIEARNSVMSVNLSENELGINLQQQNNNKFFNILVYLTEVRDLPLISMLFSIGFGFWLILVSLGYKIYEKRYEYILIYLPIIILWLTCIASPVNAEFRYAYPIFTSLPIYISLMFLGKNEKLEKINMKK